MHVQGGHFSRSIHFSSTRKNKRPPIQNQTTNKTKALQAKMRKQDAKRQSTKTLNDAKFIQAIKANPIGPAELAINLQAAYLIINKRKKPYQHS